MISDHHFQLYSSSFFCYIISAVHLSFILIIMLKRLFTSNTTTIPKTYGSTISFYQIKLITGESISILVLLVSLLLSCMLCNSMVLFTVSKFICWSVDQSVGCLATNSLYSPFPLLSILRLSYSPS